MSYKVKLLIDDPRFNLFKGDILEVKPYSLDSDKVVVIKRISDGLEPGCTQYQKDTEKIK